MISGFLAQDSKAIDILKTSLHITTNSFKDNAILIVIEDNVLYVSFLEHQYANEWLDGRLVQQNEYPKHYLYRVLDMETNSNLDYPDPRYVRGEELIPLVLKQGNFNLTHTTIKRMDGLTIAKVKAYALAGLLRALGEDDFTCKKANSALVNLGVTPLPKWYRDYITNGITFEEGSSNGKMTVADVIGAAKISSRES